MNIENISELATKAANLHETLQTSIAVERDAEAAILTQVIDSVRPALKAICSKHYLTCVTHWPDTIRSVAAYSNPFKGLSLTPFGPERDYPNASRGEYESKDLVLLDTGDLARIEWSGHWSSWQGERSQYTGELCMISIRESMNHWLLSDCVTAIQTALQKYVDGNAEKVAKRAQAQAEKLQALSKLIRG